MMLLLHVYLNGIVLPAFSVCRPVKVRFASVRCGAVRWGALKCTRIQFVSMRSSMVDVRWRCGVDSVLLLFDALTFYWRLL